MKYTLVLLLILCSFFSCKTSTPDTTEKQNLSGPAQLNTQKVLQTIAFGSCNREDLPQPMWTAISAHNPDLWIWLGDNIYGDTDNMGVMKRKYDKQQANPAYAEFRSLYQMIGIWDDHDFGLNDGGREYKPKEASKQLMLDFLGVPESAPQRSRAGAYASYTFGEGEKKVKVILLDGRWFRDKIVKEDGAYQVNTEGDLLGEQQWKWFDNELKNSDAQIHLIACGIQMLPEDHRFEKWANFPHERKRLLALLELEKPAGLVLLSGDRHIGEFSRYIPEGSTFEIFEVTSSGLTHSYESVGDEPNRHRVGQLTGEKNFGLLHIDWRQSPPGMVVELRGVKDNIISSEKLSAK